MLKKLWKRRAIKSNEEWVKLSLLLTSGLIFSFSYLIVIWESRVGESDIKSIGLIGWSVKYLLWKNLIWYRKVGVLSHKGGCLCCKWILKDTIAVWSKTDRLLTKCFDSKTSFFYRLKSYLRQKYLFSIKWIIVVADASLPFHVMDHQKIILLK